MDRPTGTVPRARGARITYHLLLRQWTGLPGFTTTQAQVYLGLSTWTSAHYLLATLAARPELPVYQEGRLWRVRYEPRDLVPAPVQYTALQRASLVTQRLVCRALLDDIEGIDVDDLCVLLGLTPGGVVRLMEAISTRWGAPVWNFGTTWHIMLEHFREFPKSMHTA